MMHATLTLDEAGRVVIPPELREALHLAAGDRLELETRGKQIILRPAHDSGAMVQEDGIWMFRTGKRLSARVADATLHSIRRERDTPSQDEQA